MTDNSRLCKVCQGVIDTANLKVAITDFTLEGNAFIADKETIYPHHASVQVLREAVRAGCPLCTLLGSHFSNSRYPPESKSDRGQVGFTYSVNYNTEDENHYAYEFRMVYEDAKLRNDYIDILRIYALPIKSPEGMARGEPTSHTGSKETWDVALRWLRHCKTTHSKCNQTSQAKWLPTRVLNVGTMSEPCLRLYITEERPPDSQYVTLSHCWGQTPIKTLLEANISEFTEGIDAAELPNTFQDAIVIARRLGVPFLWIDSLCIIQDSVEDWAKESSSMGNVYRNSLCNIAATAAPDGRTGCFLPHNPALARTCRLRIDGLPGPAPKSKLYDLVQSNFWRHGIDFEPLIHRGWILQERVLAPRVIHFGRSQLLWECYELDACEMYPQGVPKAFLRGKIGFKQWDPATGGAAIVPDPSLFTFDRSWPLDDSMIKPFIMWNGIIQEYTKCNLTKSKDRLIAISAIAKQFQPLFKDQYVAGLWRRHLTQQLLWATLSPGNVHDDYIAPTWSWASVNGPVQLYARIAKHDKPVMIDILEVKIETRTADRMGQVLGGHIKLRGWLKGFPPPELQTYKASDSDSDGGDGGDDGDPMYMFKAQGLEFCFFRPDKLPLPADPKWYCLPVLETLDRDPDDKSDEEEIEILGLVLLETGTENEFRRVGTFTTAADGYKNFKRPTYPFRAIQDTEEAIFESPSARAGRAQIDTAQSPAAVRQGAAETETNQTASSSSAPKRRFVPFLSRGGRDEDAPAKEKQDSASGGREWWRIGQKKDPWVDRVITIV